jgi:hypothetical protein
MATGAALEPGELIDGATPPPSVSLQAARPLRIHPSNPRYFADEQGKAVLLTGAHTWNNLLDMGRDTPPQPFDFGAYLDFLGRHRHNFIRLWAWDSVTWDTRANGHLGKDYVHQVGPLPWLRTGPGQALDGQPKFDLTKFNPAYFARLRERLDAASQRRIYVSVMLFEGWGLRHGNRGRAAPDGWAWRGHPFNPANNVNRLEVKANPDGLSGEVHALGSPGLNAVQAAYIRKVIDTVNDLGNVLYEVINEGGQTEWDWWVVRTIRDYERTKSKQHPVGLTGHGAERLASMLASPAQWISPGRADGYGDDPPAWDGKKVSLLDTDHIWGVGGSAAWVWKAVLRGHNPIFMDPYDGLVLGTPGDPQFEPIRRAMGQARRLAERANLAALQPHDEVASSGYCLANPGEEYVAFLPDGGKMTLNLTDATGALAAEWTHPVEGRVIDAGTALGGSQRSFEAPDKGNWVLRLFRKQPARPRS